MSYETVSDLIKAFREDEKDLVEPYFWSDPQLVRFINSALTAFCERSKSVIDEIEVEASEAKAELPSYVIDVLEAAFVVDGRLSELEVVSRGVLGLMQRQGKGRPRSIIIDQASNKMQLVPEPTAAGAVLLNVVRRPTKLASKESKLNDIKPAYRDALLLYVKHRAYGVKDAELFDAIKSGQFLSEFNYECRRAYESELLRRGATRRIKPARW